MHNPVAPGENNLHEPRIGLVCVHHLCRARIRHSHAMNNECRALLSLVTLPARLNRTQTADYLGFEPDHITLLIKAGLLKPLGRPKPNSDKYFAAVKLAELRQDEQWLSRATQFICQHWNDKNNRSSRHSNRAVVTTPES
jgi:hypothetical protein